MFLEFFVFLFSFASQKIELIGTASELFNESACLHNNHKSSTKITL